MVLKGVFGVFVTAYGTDYYRTTGLYFGNVFVVDGLGRRKLGQLIAKPFAQRVVWFVTIYKQVLYAKMVGKFVNNGGIATFRTAQRTGFELPAVGFANKHIVVQPKNKGRVQAVLSFGLQYVGNSVHG